MMLDLVYLILGAGILALGGELLIKGSMSAAVRLRISPLLVGLIIVGFGTSAPEFVVSFQAAIAQKPDIAVGNVIGSNVGNILLILGICTLISPLTVKPMALRRDATMVVVTTLLLIVFIWNGTLVRAHGLFFLFLLVGYLGIAYWNERYTNAPSGELHRAEAKELSTTSKPWLLIIILVAAGLTLLVTGSQTLLTGAIGLAEQFDVSEALIGLTLVALGTSLPELSISVIAAVRGHADVAIGNVLGSNIFNVLGILGFSSIVQDIPINPRILDFDVWIMLGASSLLLVFLNTGWRLSRGEGVLFLLAYAVYVTLSILHFNA